MVNSNVDAIKTEAGYESIISTPAEQERIARLHAEAQERWTQLIRRRRIEEYGDPDSALPVWPVRPPEVPIKELRRIHELIEREFGYFGTIHPDAA